MFCLQYVQFFCKSLFAHGNGLSASDYSDREMQCFEEVSFTTAAYEKVTRDGSEPRCPDYNMASKNRSREARWGAVRCGAVRCGGVGWGGVGWGGVGWGGVGWGGVGWGGVGCGRD